MVVAGRPVVVAGRSVVDGGHWSVVPGQLCVALLYCVALSGNGIKKLLVQIFAKNSIRL